MRLDSQGASKRLDKRSLEKSHLGSTFLLGVAVTELPFPELLLSARPYCRHVTYVTPDARHSLPCPHECAYFTAEQTEHQRSWLTCPRSHIVNGSSRIWSQTVWLQGPCLFHDTCPPFSVIKTKPNQNKARQWWLQRPRRLSCGPWQMVNISVLEPSLPFGNQFCSRFPMTII